MLVAIFFSNVVLASMLLVCFMVLHGVKQKYITPIFGMVLIVCAVATSTWTMTMIFNKVPAMVSTN